MMCSIECNTRMLSVVAASLANGGVCPLTAKRIFRESDVKNVLALMQTCGMYDFSGEFAFSVGIPTKSGVGGALLIVIPGVAGFATWSPRLDAIGNSVRGVEFCLELSRRFDFHTFATMPTAHDVSQRESDVSEDKEMIQEELKCMKRNEAEAFVALLWSAAAGDARRLCQIVCRGIDPVSVADYDRRTALHLAASNGHLGIAKQLLRMGCDKHAIDAFDGTPLDDAQRESHPEVVTSITEWPPEPTEAVTESWLVEESDGTSIVSREDHRPRRRTLSNASHSMLSSIDWPLPLPPNRFLEVLNINGACETTLGDLQAAITDVGLRLDDVRIASVLAGDPATPLTQEGIHDRICSAVDLPLLVRALQGKLKVQDWQVVCDGLRDIFNECEVFHGGAVADYIPSLAAAEPEQWGVALCSVDGQRFSVGDATSSFAIQSCSKVLTYCIALEEHGQEKIYEHVGREPSGRRFNAICLDERRVEGGGRAVPHNPVRSSVLSLEGSCARHCAVLRASPCCSASLLRALAVLTTLRRTRVDTALRLALRKSFDSPP